MRAATFSAAATARRVVLTMAVMLAPSLHAQTSISVASGTVSVPSPRRANYESSPGESAIVTVTRNVTMACGNVNAGCVATVRLTSTLATTISSIKLTYTVPSGNECSSAGGTFTRTITSTAGDSLFTAKKNQTCVATITAVSVNNLSYTAPAYRAAAGGVTATQTLTFGFR